MTEGLRYIWQNKNWTDFTWDSRRLLPLLSRARKVQGQVLSKVKDLGLSLTGEAQTEILTEEAVKTSAIEGETLNRDSVRSSVVRHLGLDRQGLPRPPRHVDGLVDILFDAARNYRKPLTMQRLKGWQAVLFPTGYSGLRKIRAGQLRARGIQVVSGAIGRERIHFQAPPAEKLGEEMKKFLIWWKKSLFSEEGFLRAGVAHFWFVTIHPFDDGNGRVARAITDMALAQDEKLPIRFYSLSSSIMESRGSYYTVLERCSKGGSDITEWLVWFLECLIRAMEKSESLIAKVLAKVGFWQRHSQTPMNDRQRKVVNRLLDAGKGRFEGGLTTRKYVSLTKVSRATAFREISDLVEKKVLAQNPRSKGRSVSYDIMFQGL